MRGMAQEFLLVSFLGMTQGLASMKCANDPMGRKTVKEGVGEGYRYAWSVSITMPRAHGPVCTHACRFFGHSAQHAFAPLIL